MCKGRCPLCRAAIEGSSDVGHVPAATLGESAKRSLEASTSGAGPSKVAKPSYASGSPSDSESDYDPDEIETACLAAEQAAKVAKFEAAVRRVDADQPKSVDGVIRIMKSQIEFNPSSRMLLCFGFESDQRGEVANSLRRIERELVAVNLTDVEAAAKSYERMDAALLKFDDPARYPDPQVFLINTTESSSSVMGLDLHKTDLTILADNCSKKTQRQAAGRSLRMRPRPAEMKSDEKFPAKRIVMLQLHLGA
jgi:hypothetical protein